MTQLELEGPQAGPGGRPGPAAERTTVSDSDTVKVTESQPGSESLAPSR